MSAGRRRAWPTWFAIPKASGRHHSRSSRSPIRCVNFTKDDIAFVYGSKWKQRYFTKIGDDYFRWPRSGTSRTRLWRPYTAAHGTDWWPPFYPPDNMQRPTGPLCDGCHSVNYDIDDQNRDRVERRV